MREADLGEVFAEVLEALEVRVEHRRLRVGDEDDAVDAFEDELARRVVEDLAGDRVELQARLESADDADVDRQQVEEERAVGLGLQAHHLAAALRRGLGVDVVEVGRLPTEARTVVNDLRRHLHRRVVEEDHASVTPRRKAANCANCSTPRGYAKATTVTSAIESIIADCSVRDPRKESRGSPARVHVPRCAAGFLRRATRKGAARHRPRRRATPHSAHRPVSAPGHGAREGI